MDEKNIIEFREKAISYFIPILLKNGYSQDQAGDLAFYIAKVLEDSYPLIVNIEESEQNVEKIMDNIHLLYANQTAFEEGKKILMWES